MHDTKKAISKYSNMLILSPVIGLMGIVTFFVNYNDNKGVFETIGSSGYGIVLVGVSIAMFISFNHKIKNIKGNFFKVTEDGVEFKTDSHYGKFSCNELLNINKGIETLSFTVKPDMEVNISLKEYFLSFEESKQLDLTIAQLQSKISKQ